METLQSWIFATVLIFMLIDSPSIVRAIEPTASPVAQQQISIATARSELTLFVGSDNRLYQLGYDKRDAELPEPKKLNRLQEFHPAAGNGFIEEPAIQAFHVDGNTSTDLAYVRHTTERVDDNVSITHIELKDPAYPFFVTLCFLAFADEDMIEQWAEIRHNENGPVTLFRFASSAPLLKGKDFWLTQFQGDYKHEATVVEEHLTPGIKVLDSKIGVLRDAFPNSELHDFAKPPGGRRGRHGFRCVPRVVRKFSTRLRAGFGESASRAVRDQSVRIAISTRTGESFHHARDALGLQRARQGPDQPQFPPLGAAIRNSRRRQAAADPAEQLGGDAF